ncbi:MAG: selenocysteine-specific translation elongation factor [Desulfobacterales bacterium]|nr:selenocysteine-specific translation elongation factor [Desulfobacterales bacterium]
MKPIILGTAGHIDHGKTSLIKSISGIDTDRLKEEKLRGITIELGFASMVLPSGRHLGIVDVPGHEKFIKNMVAGATGIDLVAMVIAADEGVMPQTREHMEICGLLGIKHGIVVLTKADLVDTEWLDLVAEDIRDFTRGTFLENAPFVPVSSTKGTGIPEFIQALDKLSDLIPSRSASGIFRLPIDRVFTIKGFGTVITGTLISGRVQVGDPVMIYPSGIKSKVRGIQVYNQNATTAEAGMRTAINFQALDKASILRGEVVSTPGALRTSYMVDVWFHFVGSNKKPIKNRTRVRFHTGTSEIMGNLILLDKKELQPNESSVAQIRLDAPVAIVKDDRFVIRSYSPIRTIGGGQVLNPIPQKHKTFKAEIIAGLQGLAGNTPQEIISHHLQQAGDQGLGLSDLSIMSNLPDKDLQQALQNLQSQKIILLFDRENHSYVHQDNFEKLKGKISALIGDYHDANPLKPGISKEELKSKFPSYLNVKLFFMTLNQLIKDDKITQQEDLVRLTGHRVSLGINLADISKKILNIYQEGGLTPPYFREVCKDFDMDAGTAKDVLLLLVNEGCMVKIKEDLYFHSDALNAVRQRLVDFLKTHGEMTTFQFKEMTGVSRKYLIPLMEYFDQKNLTIRVGDVRKLRTNL